jgi:SAM-dependent methyltransferase
MLMRADLLQAKVDYAASLAEKGATPAAVGWPSPAHLATHFQLMLEPVIPLLSRRKKTRLLDIGCGPGLLLDYLSENGLLSRIDYLGIDIAPEGIEAALQRWPAARFEMRDVRDQPLPPNSFDYAVICGVFGYRGSLDHRAAEQLVHETLSAIWPSVTFGLTFNVWPKHVDWERDCFFYWPLDALLAFCKAQLPQF